MSGVLASRGDPGSVTLLTGNKPLHLRHHRGYRVVVYASDATFLGEALDGESGWWDLAMPPMTRWPLRTPTCGAVPTRPLTFIAQDRRGTIPAGDAP